MKKFDNKNKNTIWASGKSQSILSGFELRPLMYITGKPKHKISTDSPIRWRKHEHCYCLTLFTARQSIPKEMTVLLLLWQIINFTDLTTFWYHLAAHGLFDCEWHKENASQNTKIRNTNEHRPVIHWSVNQSKYLGVILFYTWIKYSSSQWIDNNQVMTSDSFQRSFSIISKCTQILKPFQIFTFLAFTILFEVTRSDGWHTHISKELILG